jgi:hypothetical protein
MSFGLDPAKPVPNRLRLAAVQMVFADSVDGNFEKIERAATRAAKAGAWSREQGDRHALMSDLGPPRTGSQNSRDG